MDSKSITLYKNKGETNDCNNYRGISLLSIFGKVFAPVILIRLQKLAERIYMESQCGFRAERSTKHMGFSLRQIQEKYREQQMPLYIAFIELTNAIDLVSRDGLFKVPPKIGCLPKLQSMIESSILPRREQCSSMADLRSHLKSAAASNKAASLLQRFFGIFFGLLLKHVFDRTTEGIYLRTRSDGRLFNLARLRAMINVRKVLIRGLLFADDPAVVTHTQEELPKGLIWAS